MDPAVMEEVRCAAAAFMAHLIPTAQQQTADYSVCRAARLSNTFVNFTENQGQLMRRSRSVASLLSTGDGKCDGGVGVSSMASTELVTEAPMSVTISSDVTSSAANEESGSERGAEEQFTTVTLQNLPRSLTQMDLLKAMDTCGLQGAYDYCYVPAIFWDGSCRGYAFINFKTHASAA
eukprot:5173497-Amphidinium_carterae.1